MRYPAPIGLLLLACVWAGCTAHTIIEPTPRGGFSPSLGIGGPIVEAFDTRIPMPYLTGGGDYGLTETISLHGNAHLLPIPFGIVGADVGGFWFPLLSEGWSPTLGVGMRGFAFLSVREGVSDRFMGFPALSGSVAWRAGAGRIFAGADVAIPVADRAYDEDAHPVLFSPFVGYRWDASRRVSVFVELKMHGLNVVTDQLVTGYTAIGGHGALTPLIAVQRKVGR